MTNHWADYRDVNLIGLATLVFISMTLNGVTSFTSIKYLRHTHKRLYYNLSCLRDFLCDGGKPENVKGTFAFSSLIVLSNRNGLLLTSDLFPKISLGGGQS